MQRLELIALEQPFFAGLGPEFGSAVSGFVRNLRFADGAYLFREGEPANEFYLIRQGTVALKLDSPGQQPIVVALNRDVPVMMRLRLQILVPVSVSCSGLMASVLVGNSPE
jgi:CRP-like cAMP-binding protein